MSGGQEVYSSENEKMLTEIISTIKQIQQIIADTQQKENFQRFIGQEIYWVLNKWLEILFSQNFTHITKQNEDSLKQFLSVMKAEFQAIQNLIREINFGKDARYQKYASQLTKISKGFQNLLSMLIDNESKGLIKMDGSSQKSELEQYLCLPTYVENKLAQYDDKFFSAIEQFKKSAVSFKSDIAYLIIPPIFSAIATYEVEDLYTHFENFCSSEHMHKLQREIHLNKLYFYLDFDNQGQIETGDIDDFFALVWCNLFERSKFLNDKPFFNSNQKPNQYRLDVKLIKHSKKYDPKFPTHIKIDERGLIVEGKEREKIRNPVRFGRRAQNNLIPCDVYFGSNEMTISKRQFVIKPDFNDYFTYCISTTNPTEFLVKNDGAYITTGSYITLSDRVCFVVKECVVKGDEADEEEYQKKMLLEMQDNNENGPTVRRGKKNNLAVQKIQQDANKFNKIQNTRQFNEQQILQKKEEEDDDEETCKEEHKTYEKKKGGMREIKEFFQQRINNENPINMEEDGQYVTQEFKKQKYKVKNNEQLKDNRCIPNRDLTNKDIRKKDKTYLQLELDWCDLDCEEDILKEVERFNKTQLETNCRHVKIGSAGGCELKIKDPLIKEFHTYFRYQEKDNRWMVFDDDQHLMPCIMQRDQYTTIAFKGNYDKHHSELYRIYHGTVIVVSGNFLDCSHTDVEYHNKIRNQYLLRQQQEQMQQEQS